MTRSAQRSLLFGVLCACVGSLFGIWVLVTATGEGWGSFFVAAAAAAFACGAVLWRLLPERMPRRPLAWGATAGALAGVVSHYFTWYFQYVGANVCYWLTGGCTSSLGEPPANLFEAVPGSAGFAFFSLLGFGWLTLAIGAALGLAFASRTRRQAR